MYLYIIQGQLVCRVVHGKECQDPCHRCRWSLEIGNLEALLSTINMLSSNAQALIQIIYELVLYPCRLLWCALNKEAGGKRDFHHEVFFFHPIRAAVADPWGAGLAA
jgi:hypothetical protein